MVISRLAQICLLKMLKAERTDQVLEGKQTAYFHDTMKILEENGYIVIDGDGSNKKFFRLTTIGRIEASLIAKWTKTNPKYLKHAYMIVGMVMK